MLKFYRKNIKLIIWAIVLSFVAWGVGTVSISKESASPYRGTIGGEKISHKEFSTTLRYYDLLTRIQTALGEGSQKTEKAPENAPISYEELKGLTWQVLLVSRKAEKEGIQVSDLEVKEEIEKFFSSGGQFNQAFYQNWIQKNFGGRARDFEEITRKHLAVQKIREKILADVPEAEREAKWLEWLRTILSRNQIKEYAV